MRWWPREGPSIRCCAAGESIEDHSRTSAVTRTALRDATRGSHHGPFSNFRHYCILSFVDLSQEPIMPRIQVFALGALVSGTRERAQLQSTTRFDSAGDAQSPCISFSR